MSHHKEMREARQQPLVGKLEEGRYYKRRDGLVVGPVYRRPLHRTYPYAVADIGYTLAGQAYLGQFHSFDLVEEVAPPHLSGANSAIGAAVKVETPQLTGTKHDTGKPRLELIPRSAIEAEARVLTHGAERYGLNNWRRGFDFSRLIGAMLRHTHAYNSGEDIDPESGLPHLAHIRATAGFLIEFMEKGLGNDDRTK